MLFIQYFFTNIRDVSIQEEEKESIARNYLSMTGSASSVNGILAFNVKPLPDAA